jgi:hypothetical protein
MKLLVNIYEPYFIEIGNECGDTYMRPSHGRRMILKFHLRESVMMNQTQSSLISVNSSHFNTNELSSSDRRTNQHVIYVVSLLVN